ncbi:hypothetical protein CSAL01_05696 [Colletotrichum salicis]|uniref:Uncharacterized protein n=1 Tax=Colletotrichum salicis TaxID=1209931 RepID=A0A135UJ53_9PEZI|nr:hypothetical protein CSAL01_05696 [Colletotrichum salicis]
MPNQEKERAHLWSTRRPGPAAVLDQDAIPPGIIRIRQRAEDALVSIYPGEEQRSNPSSSSSPSLPGPGGTLLIIITILPGALQIPPQRLLRAPHPRHPILITPHVLPRPETAPLQRLVNVGVPLARDEAAAPAVAEICAEAEAGEGMPLVAGRTTLPLVAQDERSREAALDAGGHPCQVVVGQAPI